MNKYIMYLIRIGLHIIRVGYFGSKEQYDVRLLVPLVIYNFFWVVFYVSITFYMYA